MKIVILFLILVLLLMCLSFQIRDIFIMKKYQKTNNENFQCGFLIKEINKMGYTISECKNVLCKKDFKRNKNVCPLGCRGRIYTDTQYNLEMMFSTDNFYCVKKIVYLLGTLLSTILTVLNIFDKLKLY